MAVVTSYGGAVAEKPKRLQRYTKADRDTILAKYRKLQRLHRATRADLKMREYEMGSLNLWLEALLGAIKEVRTTFRNLDSPWFETDEGDVRLRDLSKYEKAALTSLYAAMNEPATCETKAQSETSSLNSADTAHKAGNR